MLDVPSSVLISRLCYVLTVLFNSFLIFLTLHYTKAITGIYRNMIITFAAMGISFSTLDILVRPMFHSYNGCLLYFTLGNSFRFSKTISELSLLFYCGTYAVILGFLTVQFMYRACVLSRPKSTRHFAGRKLIFWIIYALTIGFIWACATSFLHLDDNVYNYLRAEILEWYGIEIRNVPGFAVLAYNGEGETRRVRWNSVGAITSESLLLSTQYTLMLVSGVSMYKNISGNLNTSSSYYSGLQQQFFYTLIYQVSAPSLIFHGPILIVLVAPFFDFKFSFHSQVVLYGFSVYPLVDSLIVFNVIKEYRHICERSFKWLISGVYNWLGKARPPSSTDSLTASAMTKTI